MANEQFTHRSVADILGALGPGGTAAIDFEDYKRAFGKAPDEPAADGHKAIADLVAKHDCTHEVDHAKRRVLFWKRK